MGHFQETSGFAENGNLLECCPKNVNMASKDTMPELPHDKQMYEYVF
jgi:hypothetical protein